MYNIVHEVQLACSYLAAGGIHHGALEGLDFGSAARHVHMYTPFTGVRAAEGHVQYV